MPNTSLPDTDHGQLRLFDAGSTGSSHAKLTKSQIQNLAKSLMVPDVRCETCGITRCDAIFGGAADGRTYLSVCPWYKCWRDVETGVPATLPVQNDEFPPDRIKLAAYYSKGTVVVRCDRHRPRNGKKVELELWL